MLLSSFYVVIALGAGIAMVQFPSAEIGPIDLVVAFGGWLVLRASDELRRRSSQSSWTKAKGTLVPSSAAAPDARLKGSALEPVGALRAGSVGHMGWMRTDLLQLQSYSLLKRKNRGHSVRIGTRVSRDEPRRPSQLLRVALSTVPLLEPIVSRRLI